MEKIELSVPLGEQTPPPSPPSPPPAIEKPSGFSEKKIISSSSRKCFSPGVLQVPKVPSFPERYMSPTDQIVSPVSKRIVARNRKGISMLAQAKNSAEVSVFDSLH